MKFPAKSEWKEFGTLFLVQFISYCLFCLSLIVVTRGNYFGTMVTDTLYSLNSYLIIRRVATHQNSTMGITGYTLGGTFGSMMAIWITNHFSGISLWFHHSIGR